MTPDFHDHLDVCSWCRLCANGEHLLASIAQAPPETPQEPKVGEHVEDIAAIVSSYGWLLMRLAVTSDPQDTYDLCKREFDRHQAALKRLQDAFLHHSPPETPQEDAAPAPPQEWLKVIHAIAVEAMTAQSDPNAEAAKYRKALIGICNMALKAQSVIGNPPPSLLAAPPMDLTNHHNALACPYCNPDARSLLAAPEGRVRALIGKWRKEFLHYRGLDNSGAWDPIRADTTNGCADALEAALAPLAEPPA